MTTRKILTVLGARPQFIKASAVSAALSESRTLREVVVHTGQHFDANMSAVFFDELGMREPDYCCGIHGGSHGSMTGRMLIEIERLLAVEAPDAVLVYGDTNSTLAGALAAVKQHLPVAHVEAGLRSFNMSMPEEINRILTDRVSKWLFVPTLAAAAHLAREAADQKSIHLVGDVMFDVVCQHGRHITADEGLLASLARKHGIVAGAYCLATVHRAENTDDEGRLTAIIRALSALGRDLPVIFPLHPRTRQILLRMSLFDSFAASVILTDPLGYRDMVQLEKYAALIATDSGGMQKEAFFHQVPCVTLRDETEWTELLQGGWNRLVPPSDAETVLAKLRAALGSRGATISPYGDGKAAQRIVHQLEQGLA